MAFGDTSPEYEYVHDDALLDPVLDRELDRLDRLDQIDQIDPQAGDDGSGDDGSGASGTEEAAPVAPRSAAGRKKRVGATAAMFTALAMAYREVFEPDKAQEIVMEVEADEPFLDGPVQVLLEPGNPRAGRIIVRRA